MLSQLDIWVFVCAVAAFWFIVNLLKRTISLEKYGIKVSLVFIKYESKKFKSFLDKTSQQRQKVWKVFSNLSVAVGAGSVLFAVYFLAENLVRFAQPGREGSPVLPVLPGLTIRVYWLPYFILGFLVAALTHEAAHGIVARIEGISIKSAGLFLALVQPGGFVDPDEKDLERSSTVSKMRVLSAGSSMNLIVGLLVLLTISAIFPRIPSGIVVIDVLEGGPLEQAGLHRWDVIYAVNRTSIRATDDLDAFMADVVVGDSLILSTSRGEVQIVAAPHPVGLGRAIIGIASSMLYYPSRLNLGSFWSMQLYTTLNWMFLVLVNVAIVNMLPIPLLDGDRFLQHFLTRYAKNEWVRKSLNTISLFLIVANMILSVEKGLFLF